MPRNAQIIRFMALLRELDTLRGLYVPKLAKSLGVTKRTIYRDLEAIEDSGYPIYKDKIGSRPAWRFVESYKSSVKELSISSSEMLAMWSALSLLKNLKGTPFEGDLTNLIRKIEALNNNGNGLKKLGKTLFVQLSKGAKDYSAHGRIIRNLLKAIMESRVCLLDYYSFHSEKMKKLEIHPYHLSEYRKGLYIHCYSIAHAKYLMLAVERIEKLTISEQMFDPDNSIDFENLTQSGIGIVSGKQESIELTFPKKVAKYIKERQWHPSQKIKSMKNGGVNLSLKACVDFELVHWISGFGPFVKVIKPINLKKQIAQRHADALHQYDSVTRK